MVLLCKDSDFITNKILLYLFRMNTEFFFMWWFNNKHNSTNTHPP